MQTEQGRDASPSLPSAPYANASDVLSISTGVSQADPAPGPLLRLHPSPSLPVSSRLGWCFLLLLLCLCSCLPQGTLLAAASFSLADVHQNLVELSWQQSLHQLEAGGTKSDQFLQCSAVQELPQCPALLPAAPAHPNLRMNLVKRFLSFMRKWRLMSSERLPMASSCQHRQTSEVRDPCPEYLVPQPSPAPSCHLPVSLTPILQQLSCVLPPHAVLSP